MVFKKLTAAALIGASLTATFAPSAALAQDRHGRWEQTRYDSDHYQRRGYRDAGYRAPRRCGGDNTAGLIIGGALGALLGRAVDTRGERTTGTVLGAGAGALLGREVANGRC